MKKVALSLLALAVVGVSAFADAPKWDPKVSTGFKGEATATLGYDVDTGLAAFKNTTSVSLIIDLVSGGDAVTASDKDVWGEIRIKTDGDPYRIKADGVSSDGKATYEPGFKLQVDYAKIHFGKNAYLSVTSKDTKIGYVNSFDQAFLGHFVSHYWNDSTKDVASTTTTTVYVASGTETVQTGVTYKTGAGVAVAATALTANQVVYKTVVTAASTNLTSTRYGHVGDAAFKALDSVGAASAGGFEVGASLDKVASVAVTLGSTTAWSTDFVNAGVYSELAYKVTVGLLAVDNLTLEGGYSAQTGKDTIKVIGAKAAYKYAIDGDKLYVKPQVGFANITPAGPSAKAYNTATASVLLGTGAKAAQFDNYGLKLDSDYGAYPGVSVGVAYSDIKVVNETGNKKATLPLNVSVNSGSLIADTTVVAAYDVADLNADDIFSIITVGASTSVKAGDITLAPKGLVVYEGAKGAFPGVDNDAIKAKDSAAFLKGNLDVTGAVPFTTFSFAYESNDLLNGYIADFAAAKPKAQTVGKLEFTVKVAF